MLSSSKEMSRDFKARHQANWPGVTEYDMVATVKENYILFKVREKLGSFVSGHGISKSLFKVNEKSGNFILKGSANYFTWLYVLMFSYRKGNFVLKIVWAILSYFHWFMARIIISQAWWKYWFTTALQSMKRLVFVLVCGNPGWSCPPGLTIYWSAFIMKKTMKTSCPPAENGHETLTYLFQAFS